MTLFPIAFVSCLAFVLAFRFYGRFLARTFKLNEDAKTPSVLQEDGVDYVPTKPPILLGQHFAAIAAVGPIAGPILAGMDYGWLPGMVWVVLGAIFIGGVHDFAALVASVRHGARSVAELVKEYIGPRAYILFLGFIWLSLIYVIVVFTDLTASAFVSAPYGPGVATSSFLYLLLAVVMGIALYKFKLSLVPATAIFVPCIFILIFVGQNLPVSLPPLFGSPQKSWDLVILGYCFAASIIPLWILLQPRGYLGGFILYTTFAAGLIGMFAGGLKINYPAYIPNTLIGFPAAGAGLVLFPLLFTTIACGACSGFHGLVSSGTTSKQLEKETHAPIVGYGGMLMEGFVAVISLSTVMMLTQGAEELKLGPDEIYARGLAHFMTVFGIPFAAGVTFGKLAFATFIYDTLDVATRLGRYVFQELTGVKGKTGAIAATLATLILPAVTLMITLKDPSGKVIPLWKVVWPIFGTSNQLLAALSLVGITMWMKRTGLKWQVAGIPMMFMLLVTFFSFILILKPYVSGIFSGGKLLDPIGITGVVLFALAALVVIEAAKSLKAESRIQN